MFNMLPGDTPPHTMWDESYNSQLNCTQTLIEKSEEILGAYRVFPNIGNHGGCSFQSYLRVWFQYCYIHKT